jgi:hypothetical protein
MVAGAAAAAAEAATDARVAVAAVVGLGGRTALQKLWVRCTAAGAALSVELHRTATACTSPVQEAGAQVSAAGIAFKGGRTRLPGQRSGVYNCNGTLQGLQ